MKERLTDVISLFERLIRAEFYMGAGVYLAAKALIIIPQHPGFPDFLTIPAFLIAIVGGAILGFRVLMEPTPRQLREAKKKAELNDEISQKLSKWMMNGGM